MYFARRMQKPLIFIMLLVITAAVFCSCSLSRDEAKSSSGGDNGIEKNSNRNNSINESIKIYTFRNHPFIRTSMQQYSRGYSDVQIEAVNFEDLNEYRNKLSSEAMAGEGPDIVYFNSYTIGSIFKVLENGVFSDLQPLIDNDPSFDISHFHPAVFDCGFYKGKRLFIPVSYSIPFFITTSELLSEHQLNFDKENFSHKEFMRQLDAFISNADLHENRYLFTLYYGLDDLLLCSGIDFIDYEKKKVDVHNEGFKEIVTDYIKLEKLSSPVDVRGRYKEQGYGMLKSGNALFLNEKQLLRLSEINLYTSYFKTLLSQEPKLYAFPTYSGNSDFRAMAEDCVAISVNSKNKQAAFNFIKIMLSETMQTDYRLSYLPVNNKAMQSNLETYKIKVGEKVIYNGLDVIVEPLPEEFEKKLRFIIDNVTACKITDFNMILLMYNSLAPYVAGESSLENCLDEMENKLMLYLNE